MVTSSVATALARWTDEILKAFRSHKYVKREQYIDSHGRIAYRYWYRTPSGHLVAQERPKPKMVPAKSGKTTVPHVHGLPLPAGNTLVWKSEAAAGNEFGLVAITLDRKGRRQSVYSDEHWDKAARVKWDRTGQLLTDLPTIRMNLLKQAKSGASERARQSAEVTLLIDQTGMRRWGSTKSSKAERRAFGASTLQANHVTIKGKIAILKYTAKGGKEQQKEVTNPWMVGRLRSRKQEAEKAGGLDVRIFPAVTQPSVGQILKQAADGKDYKPKDLRTVVATVVAKREIKRRSAPKTKAEVKRSRYEVAKAVAKHLGNTPAVALGSYIAPSVWRDWEAVNARQDAGRAEKAIEAPGRLEFRGAGVARRSQGHLRDGRRGHPSSEVLQGSPDRPDPGRRRVGIQAALDEHHSVYGGGEDKKRQRPKAGRKTDSPHVTREHHKRGRKAAKAATDHVPRHLLADRGGGKAGRRNLRERAQHVYQHLKTPLSKAGLRGHDARKFVQRTLERKGWTPDGRAALMGEAIGAASRIVVVNHRTISDGAENLAGGSRVRPGDVSAAVDLRTPAKGDDWAGDVATIAAKAELQLVALAKALEDGRTDPNKAAVVRDLLAKSDEIRRLSALTTAFPGLADRTAEPVRKATIQASTETNAFVAGEGGKPKAIRARYRIVSAADLVPSHDPISFAAQAKYPKGWQERAYHRDKAEQGKVIRNAERLMPALMINTNPDAVNGPPMVTANGVVLGGNSRTMSAQRAYGQGLDSADKYQQYLRNNAYQFGLRPEDVAAVKNPVLIREVDPEDKSDANMRLLVRQMNESFIQGMDPRTMQVAMGRRLSDRAMGELADSMRDDETLSAFLGTTRAQRFVGLLHKAGIIDDRNANQYVNQKTKRLNEDGKTLVSRILVGRIVQDADLLSDTRPSMVTSIARAVPYMVQAEVYGAGYNIREPLRVALDAHNDLARLADNKALKLPDAKSSDAQVSEAVEHLRSLPGVGEDHQVLHDDRARSLLEVLIRKGGPRQMAEVFKRYAKTAAQNPEKQETLGLVRKRTPAEVFQMAVEGSGQQDSSPNVKQQGLALAWDHHMDLLKAMCQRNAVRRIRRRGARTMGKTMDLMKSWTDETADWLAKAEVKVDKAGNAVLTPDESKEKLRLEVVQKVRWDLDDKYRTLKSRPDSESAKKSNDEIAADVCNSMMRTALSYDNTLLGCLRDLQGDAKENGVDIMRSRLRDIVLAEISRQEPGIKAKYETPATEPADTSGAIGLPY